MRICADGGANRLAKLLPGAFEPRRAPGAASSSGPASDPQPPLPTAVVGDFDSIEPTLLERVQALGVPTHCLAHDQDSTDLEKCLREARSILRRRRGGVAAEAENDGPVGERSPATAPPAVRPLVVAVGALGGRLDHTLGCLSTMHASRDLDLVLIGEGNAARLVPRGSARIVPDLEHEGPGCCFAALDGPATATSTGLAWELHDRLLKTGVLVSGSNEITGTEVTIRTDNDLVWITRLKGDWE